MTSHSDFYVLLDTLDDIYISDPNPTEGPTSSTGSTGSTGSTSSTAPSLEELLGLVKSTQSPTTKSPLDILLGVPTARPPPTPTKQRHTCSQGLSVKNVILNGGMGAGEVNQYPHVNDMPLCTEKCCSMPECHVAYIIHEVCYTVSCFSRDLCRTRPLESADVTSEIAYVRRDGVTMFSRAEEALVGATAPELDIETPLTSVASQRTLTDSKTKSTALTDYCHPHATLYNVRLRGDLSAGIFNDNGLVTSMERCSALCCASRSCDLAYMVGQRCYSVHCYSRELCQTVDASPLAFSPAIAYVTRRAPNGE